MNNYHLQVSKILLEEWFSKCASRAEVAWGWQEGQGVGLSFLNSLYVQSQQCHFMYFILELLHEILISQLKRRGGNHCLNIP